MATITLTNNSSARTVTIGSQSVISPTAVPTSTATAPYVTDFSASAYTVAVPAYKAYQKISLAPGKVLTITSTDSQEIAFWQNFQMDDIAVVVTGGVIADPVVTGGVIADPVVEDAGEGSGT